MIDYCQQLEIRGLDVTLSGDNYLMMCCPFHEEESPSFSVSRKNGSFRCFGCHERGDFIELIAQIDEVDLLTATSRVNNLIDPDGLVNLLDKQFTEVEKTYKYYSWKKFKEFYPSALEHDEAMVYLYNRGILRESVIQYKIRYGYHDDIFRGRIVIPIFQDGYKLVSWVGRIIGNNMYKAKTRKLGTPYYTLFGLPQLNTKVKLPYLILVEGEFDAIYLRQFGLNVVSVMGSARINKYRVKLIKGITHKVVLAFDGDKAGMDATRLNYAALSKLLPVERVVIPFGKDPNVLSTSEVHDLFYKYMV